MQDNKKDNKTKLKTKLKTKKISRNNGKNINSTNKHYSVKNNKLIHKTQTLQELIKNKILKEPEKLRVGYVSKNINGKYYIVRINSKNKKYFSVANKQEIACYLKLKENMSKFIAIYKTGKSSFSNIKSAISFAIRETEREFPYCTTTKIRYSKNKTIHNSKLNRNRSRTSRIVRTSKKQQNLNDNKNYKYNNLYYKIINYIGGLYEW